MPKHDAPDLFTATLTDDAIIELIDATAAAAIGAVDEALHVGFWGPERLRVEATTLALSRLRKARQIPKELPESVRVHIARITDTAEVADVTLRALTYDNAALDDEIQRLNALINGEAIDEEDEADDETLDAEEEEYESEADDETDEEEEEQWNAHDANPDASAPYDFGREIRDLALLTAERDRRQNPTYSRVRELESRFSSTYGTEANVLRDILVTALMADAPAGMLPAIDGCAFDDEAINDACFYIGAGAANHAEYIAKARSAENLPAPYAVDLVPHAFEQMPRLRDGVGRRYFHCPCCNQRFGDKHSCSAWNCTSVQQLYLQRSHNNRLTSRCAYSNASERHFQPDSGIPFGRSVLARRNGRTFFVSPELGHRILGAAIRQHYSNSTNLVVAFDDDGIRFTETLPEPPQVGTPVDDLLEIHAAKRIPRKTSASYDDWWFRNDSPRTNDAETIVEYATAYDVISYRSRERTTPTVLERDFGRRIPQTISAIDGDRIGSPFGPRVERVEICARKTAAPEQRLVKRVRDGDTYKVLHLTVDPITSYDDATLTAALLEALEEYRESRGTIGIALVHEYGAHGVYRLLQEAEQYEDTDFMHGWRDDRFRQGYADAVDYLESKIHDLIRCPECGVYETCHSFEPISQCTQRRANRTATTLGASHVDASAPQLALI